MRYKILYLCLLACCTACNSKEKQESKAPIQNSLEEFPQLNTENVRTYKGQVVQVFNIVDPYNYSDEIGIIVRTNRGDIPVQLGPQSFVLSGPVDLRTGKTIEVTGFEQYFDGRIYMIAQQVKLEGHTLNLRNDDGQPLWLGWEKS